MVWIYISLIINDAEHFLWAWWPSACLHWKTIYLDSLLILKQVVGYFEFSLYFGYELLIRYKICKYLLPLSKLPFFFYDGFSCCVVLSNFKMHVHSYRVSTMRLSRERVTEPWGHFDIYIVSEKSSMIVKWDYWGDITAFQIISQVLASHVLYSFKHVDVLFCQEVSSPLTTCLWSSSEQLELLFLFLCFWKFYIYFV